MIRRTKDVNFECFRGSGESEEDYLGSCIVRGRGWSVTLIELWPKAMVFKGVLNHRT